MKCSLFFCGLLLMGCSKPPGQFAYVSSAKGQICAFKIAPDGILTAASNTSTSTSAAIELSSDGSTLVTLDTGGAQAFHRDPTAGNLSEWGSLVQGGGGYGVDLVASGDNFYAAFLRQDGMTSYRLDPQEGLKNLANFNVPREEPVALAVTPNGEGLLMCCNRPSTLMYFTVTPRTGQLELGGIPSAGGNPHGVAVDPTGKWVLVVSSFNIDNDPKLFVFQRSGKDLVEAANVTIPSPHSVLIHPNGKWVYVGHYLPDSKGDKQDGVAQYMLDPANGSVKLAAEGTPDGKSLDRLALDASGQHLYALDTEGNCLLHYQLDPASGAPKLAGEPVPVEKPTDLVMTRAPKVEKN